MKHLAVTCCAAIFCAFQSWPSGARIQSGGQELCAKHRIPLVTRTGFTAEGGLLVHYRPNDQFEKIDDQTPNRIADTQSLTRTHNISKPAQITYCPKCEAEFEKFWWGHPVSPLALLGNWRAPNGFTILFIRDGKCSGTAYNGRPFVGTWRILHHGLLRVSVRGDEDPMFFTILSIDQRSLTIRSGEIGKPNERWTRI